MNNLPIVINSPAHLVGIIQSLTTGSFEKKYAACDMADVVATFAFATQDLSQEQLVLGVNTVLEMGFCPDVALFRRWCLGQKAFDTTDHVADSYIGKAGALASIKRWLDDKTAPITVAQKQAYDATYHMFEAVKHAKNADYAQTTADSAFKDSYEHIVNQLVKGRMPCQAYVAPVVITQQQDKPQDHIPASREFASSILARLGAKGMNKMGGVV